MAIWIGSKKFSRENFHHRYKLHWEQKDFKVLGVKFSLDLESMVNKNYIDKIKEVEKDIKIWSTRKLTPIGKITLIKSLFLSKLIHLISSLPNPSDYIVNKLNKMFYNFIWNNSNDKIKRELLVQTYENGGLKMINIRNFIHSIKASWASRISNKNSDIVKFVDSNICKIKSLTERGNH